MVSAQWARDSENSIGLMTYPVLKKNRLNFGTERMSKVVFSKRSVSILYEIVQSWFYHGLISTIEIQFRTMFLIHITLPTTGKKTVFDSSSFLAIHFKYHALHLSFILLASFFLPFHFSSLLLYLYFFRDYKLFICIHKTYTHQFSKKEKKKQTKVWRVDNMFVT